MNEGASRLASRPAARISRSAEASRSPEATQARRDRDVLRRERMAAPLDFRSTGPTGPGSPLRPRSAARARTRAEGRPQDHVLGQAQSQARRQAKGQAQAQAQAQARPRARPAARPAKRRPALTAWGVLLMVAGPTMTAAAVDALVTDTVHWFFDLVFIAASGHAAALVRRRDLLAGVIVPPLAYCTGLLIAVQFGVMRAGHGPVGELASLGALLAVKPRPLFLGTALAAALVATRWAGMRSLARR